MATELDAARLMVRRAAHALDSRDPKATQLLRHGQAASPPTPASRSPTRRCSCTAATATCRTIPLERIVRDLRVHQILEGTNEIMRVITARELFRQ